MRFLAMDTDFSRAFYNVVQNTTAFLYDVSFARDDANNSSVELVDNDTTTANSTCSNAYCVSDEDYLTIIHSFIFPDAYEWVLILLYALVFFVGLVGNFLVCFAVGMNRHMRTVTNLFIVNLAIADLLVLILCLIPTVLEDVTETWYMGSVCCKIVKYCQVCAYMYVINAHT